MKENVTHCKHFTSDSVYGEVFETCNPTKESMAAFFEALNDALAQGETGINAYVMAMQAATNCILMQSGTYQPVPRLPGYIERSVKQFPECTAYTFLSTYKKPENT